MLKLSIIIPAYNEEKSIKDVIEGLQKNIDKTKYSYEIIVIDDDSTDNTKAIAKSTGVTVMSNPMNLGYGAAIMSGIKKAKYDYIAMIDADGSYPTEELNKILNYSRGFDLVIGARTGKEYRGGIFKHLGRIIFYLIILYVTGEKIPDVNSGLRIFRKSLFLNFPLPILCRRFSFSTSTTLAFLANYYFVKSVPINYDRRKGKSKVRYFRDILRTTQVILEAVVYYNPLKVVLLLCLPSFISGLVFLGLCIFDLNSCWITNMIICFNSCLVIFVIGLILDLNRMNRK